MRSLTFYFPFLAALAWGAAVEAQIAPTHLPAIRTEAEFDQMSVEASEPGEIERWTKFLLPADPDDPSLLAPLFQNANEYRLHYQFLEAEFPEHFRDSDHYRSLVERRDGRKYWAGSVSRIQTADEEIYGFTVITEVTPPSELPEAEEVRGVYEDLKDVFDLRPLAYAPIDAWRIPASEWENPGFPIYLGGVVQGGYQAYTQATNYGWVRILSLEDLEEANENGLITWRDILILPYAPRDIESVVAGVVTAEPQGAFSHVAIRMARRGTPNAYVLDGQENFSEYAEKLIRLEVCQADHTKVEATLEEAEAWWAQNRPRLSETPVVDGDYDQPCDTLAEMDLSGAEMPPEARYGGKASNFARLQRILVGDFEQYREVGFAIPMRFYLEFLRANRMPSALDPAREVTYEEYLTELFSWEAFESDPRVRVETLGHLRAQAEQNGEVDPGLVTRLAVCIQDTFGSTRRMVRFRSSSNVEDALEFNGAGLYSSTSACAADVLDLDEDGPSRCDSGEEEERGIAQALKLVWASLWNHRAYEERAYYQVPQESAAMGILVSRRFEDERANGVAFTGDPARPRDRRYVVAAQFGEVSVVSPDPGITPERSLLTMDDGRVVKIERQHYSSLVGEGIKVLSDDVLEELGALLWHIDHNFPIDLGEHSREDVLLDVEFKVEANGDLAVKQVRPFLAAGGVVARPTFFLEVPEGTTACGAFVDGRPTRDEYPVKSQVRFRSGRHELPTARERFEGDLIEEILFGPDQQRAVPAGRGRFEVEILSSCSGEVVYSFSYEQLFTLPGEKTLAVELLFLEYTTRPGEPIEDTRVLDEDFLLDDLVMEAVPDGDRNRLVRYSSCSYDTIPLWDVRASLADGSTLRLAERFREPDAGSGPAGLVGARLNLRGVDREVCDYWRLVYAALHHNVFVDYWVVLDPPVDVPGVGTVHAVELEEPYLNRPAHASYLGADFQVLAEPEVTSHWKGPFGAEPPGFYRGDADANTSVNITDAIYTLRYLFASGPLPECLDAADYDDDGVLDITDPIVLLAYLFRGVDIWFPPGPFECGRDPTEDDLKDEDCQTSCVSNLPTVCAGGQAAEARR